VSTLQPVIRAIRSMKENSYCKSVGNSEILKYPKGALRNCKRRVLVLLRLLAVRAIADSSKYPVVSLALDGRRAIFPPTMDKWVSLALEGKKSHISANDGRQKEWGLSRSEAVHTSPLDDKNIVHPKPFLRTPGYVALLHSVVAVMRCRCLH
jgi:hypothetical protein